MIQSVFIEIYYLIIRIAAIKSSKAKQWIEGRKTPPKNNFNLSNTCLIHCASYGEYEQAYPFIKAYKEKFPDQSILLSFFSPSGFEKIEKPDFVDQKIYLPKDRYSDLNQLIDEFDIRKLVLVKYEFWPKLINCFLRRNINLYLISTRFEKGHPLFKFYFRKVKEALKQFKQIFVIDKTSFDLLRSKGFNNTSITGDTRFDKVLLNKQDSKPFNLQHSKKNFVLGSIWQSDWKVLEPYLTELSHEYRFIFAPHEVNQESIDFFQSRLNVLELEVGLWSEQNTDNHILVDTIGDLKYLYRFADLSYIGGGYGKGLHNILEALVFSKPCIIGPEFSRFPEVVNAVTKGIAIPIKNGQVYDAINSANKVKTADIDIFINQYTGASERILNILS